MVTEQWGLEILTRNTERYPNTEHFKVQFRNGIPILKGRFHSSTARVSTKSSQIFEKPKNPHQSNFKILKDLH